MGVVMRSWMLGCSATASMDVLHRKRLEEANLAELPAVPP